MATFLVISVPSKSTTHNHDVSFQKTHQKILQCLHVHRNIKTLNLGNQCIKITRTRTDKTAWFVTTQIYGSAQTLTFVATLWFCEAACIGEVNAGSYTAEIS